jgi:hypothetical protein
MTRSSSSRPLSPAERVVPYAIAAVAVALVWWFAAVTLAHAGTMGLPLEDGYIYLTYAKQFGRGEPFTYYTGGGYSAGSTSVLWPMVLAPFWTLGARGHALVWVSFGMCGALYTATCVGCYRVVKAIAGVPMGIVAAALVIAIAPFAWTCLSGMEVAFASALLVATLLLLIDAPSIGPPPKLLGVCLAATSLSRPEAMLLVGAIVSVVALMRLRNRDIRAAAWWLAPLAAPLAWLVANKVFAGHAMPNTGVAKSYFYMPGFDWTFWWSAVTSQTGKLVHTMFLADGGPLVWPRLVALAWLVGAVRVLLWARREKRWLVGVVLVVAPLALMETVVATSGNWEFHNFRYSAPAFPLIMMVVACGIAPMRLSSTMDDQRRVARGWVAVIAAMVALFGVDAWPRMRSDIDLYAQNVVDLDAQVVALGRYIHDRLPDAHILYHDAGAIAYYGDRPVYDMLGLVTNHQADVANNGPGSRFEFLESLPPESRPTHFAYYPSWMGQSEFYGDVVMRTPLGPQFASRRLIGDADMELIVANFDRVHTAERPLAPHPGWSMVDRVDIADIANEREHAWTGRLGRRNYEDKTAHWSVFEKEIGPAGLLLDGGRTIRGGERFTVAIDPDRPVRLLLRTGGARTYGFNEAIDKPVRLTISNDDTELAHLDIPPPLGTFVELAIDLPAQHTAELTLHTDAAAPYRAFHWFVLQPD